MLRQRGPHESESHRAAPTTEVKAAYLACLRSGDRPGALRLLVEQVERGADAAALLHEVVEPAERALRCEADNGLVGAVQALHADAVSKLSRALLQPPTFEILPNS